MFLIVAALAAPSRAQERGVLEGIVTTQRGTIPLGGARVGVHGADDREIASLLSDADGHFRFTGLPDGKYHIVVSLDGFVTTMQDVPAGTGPLAFDLPLAGLTTTVEVVAPERIVSSAETLSASETISGKETDQYGAGGGLRSALRLLASVIEVPGGVSIKGGRPTQASVQIGASTLADPAMGLVHQTLPDDAIDSVEVLPNPYAVEYGRFSSGLVVIQIRRAGDQWRTRLNNLDPTFRMKRHAALGAVKGIATFAPRLEVGGPILKDRLFLDQTAQYRYAANDVPSRPEDELRTTRWFSSFTRVDANLSPNHSLVAMAGFFPSVTKNAGLGTFVPPASTVDINERVNQAVVTERALWSDRLVGESTIQMRGYRSEITPHGPWAMELFPDTRSGSFYNAQRRTPAMFQWIDTLSGSANGPTGLHLFKLGVDVMYNRYDGSSASRPVLIRREDGTLARRLDFSGPSVESVRSTDIAFFAQDRVQPNTRWYVEYGARLDRDGVAGRWNVTPRVGAAMVLNDAGTHVLRGGYGLFYERTPSVAGAFEQFETTTERRLGADGVTLLGLPVTFLHETASDLATARSRTWDLSYDQPLSRQWALHASLLERRGSHELILDWAQHNGSGMSTLSSGGRSLYREVSAGMHFAHGPAADLNVTYSHALARSDTNALANYFDTMMWPVVAPNAYAVASADVPRRLFARGHLMPTPRWLLLGIFDWRSGLPYSVTNDALDFVGPRNARRFPAYARLEVGVEHRFHVFKFEPWIGVRAYNALDAFLPTEVQANTGSRAFGSFYNSEYRQLRLQLRFAR